MDSPHKVPVMWKVFPISYRTQWHTNTLVPDCYTLTHSGRDKINAIFQMTFLNSWTSIKISLKFVPEGAINNIPALVQIMACHLFGDKPLSEPMMIRLLTHICVTQTQGVKTESNFSKELHFGCWIKNFYQNLSIFYVWICRRMIVWQDRQSHDESQVN